MGPLTREIRAIDARLVVLRGYLDEIDSWRSRRGLDESMRNDLLRCYFRVAAEHTRLFRRRLSLENDRLALHMRRLRMTA